MKSIRYPLFASLITVLGVTPPLYAEVGFAIEEVIVTARKREESLQETPVAVSAFTSRDLELRQVSSTDNLGEITPNLTFDPVSPTSGMSSASQVYIRGVGQSDFTIVTDPGVGTYIDGVYMARSIGGVIDFMDIDRIEVLRGPQGTLFGRNTIGGAVSIHSRKPHDEMEASIKLELGDDDKFFITGKANAPISETLKGNVALSRRSRDGYVTRITDGLDLGDDDTLGARASMLWEPVDDFEAYFVFDYTKERENGAPIVGTDINDAATLARLANNFAGCVAGQAGCANSTVFLGEYKEGGTFPVFSDMDVWGVNLTMEWDVSDWLKIKSITGYRELESDYARDADHTPLLLFQTAGDMEHDQISQELQFSGASFEDRLQWLLGMYYFREEGVDDLKVTGSIFALDAGGEMDNESTAIFAQATYDLTDQLSLTFGVRQTEDKKEYLPYARMTGASTFGLPANTVPFSPGAAALAGVFYPATLFNVPGFAGPAVSPGPGVPPLATGTGGDLVPRVNNKADFDDVSVMANIAYQWTDSLMTYFTYSEGFKSGGFDQRIIALIPEAPKFSPEFVESYEVGMKADFFDNTLQVNLAAFHTDYTDLQLIILRGFAPVTFNGGEADITGFEVETLWVPTPNWQITGSLGYIDAEYVKLSADVLNNSSLLPSFDLANTPELSMSAGFAYTFPLGEWGTLTPRLDWSYTSEQFNDAVNTPSLQQDDTHLLHAALIAVSDDDKWEVALTVRNLTDETYIVTGYSAFNAGTGYEETVFSRPREWGLSLKYNFF